MRVAQKLDEQSGPIRFDVFKALINARNLAASPEPADSDRTSEASASSQDRSAEDAHSPSNHDRKDKQDYEDDSASVLRDDAVGVAHEEQQGSQDEREQPPEEVTSRQEKEETIGTETGEKRLSERERRRELKREARRQKLQEEREQRLQKEREEFEQQEEHRKQQLQEAERKKEEVTKLKQELQESIQSLKEKQQNLEDRKHELVAQLKQVLHYEEVQKRVPQWPAVAVQMSPRGVPPGSQYTSLTSAPFPSLPGSNSQLSLSTSGPEVLSNHHPTPLTLPTGVSLSGTLGQSPFSHSAEDRTPASTPLPSLSRPMSVPLAPLTINVTTSSPPTATTTENEPSVPAVVTPSSSSSPYPSQTPTPVVHTTLMSPYSVAPILPPPPPRAVVLPSPSLTSLSPGVRPPNARGDTPEPVLEEGERAPSPPHGSGAAARPLSSLPSSQPTQSGGPLITKAPSAPAPQTSTSGPTPTSPKGPLPAHLKSAASVGAPSSHYNGPAVGSSAWRPHIPPPPGSGRGLWAGIRPYQPGGQAPPPPPPPHQPSTFTRRGPWAN